MCATQDKRRQELTETNQTKRRIEKKSCVQKMHLYPSEIMTHKLSCENICIPENVQNYKLKYFRMTCNFKLKVLKLLHCYLQYPTTY